MISYDFTGKTVVVTGGARGIGKRIAKDIFQDGANVAICRHSAEGLDEVAKEIAGDEQDRFMAACADTSKPAQMRAFLDSVVERFGDVDVLINNAGILSNEDICDVTEEQWERLMGTNLKGVFFTCQWFAQHHRDTGTPGNIVNLASVSSITYIPNNLLYNVTKAGVVTLTKTLARGLGKDGIRVNAVGPGSTPTDMNAAMYADKERERALCELIPLGRRATQDDIANAVRFLASDEADYITGQVIYVDGGWTLM